MIQRFGMEIYVAMIGCAEDYNNSIIVVLILMFTFLIVDTFDIYEVEV